MAKIFGEQLREENTEAPKLIIPESFNTRDQVDSSLAGAVRRVEERRDVREKIKEGELPTSVELSRLTQNERQPKREYQEGSAITIGEQKSGGAGVSMVENKREFVESQEEPPKLIIPESFNTRDQADSSRAGAVRRVEERRDVREKIKEGELPTSVELSRLTQNERQPKREYQEGAVVIKTDEEKKQDAIKELSWLTEGIKEIKEDPSDPITEGPRVFLDADRKVAFTRMQAERSFIKKAEQPYEVATGEKLGEKSKELAIKDAKDEGFKALTKEEFFSEDRLKKLREIIMQKEYSSIIMSEWGKLSDDQKKKYEQVDNNGRKGAVRFAIEMERDREELKKRGIEVSKESFYDMIRGGLKPSEIQIKKKGFWGFRKKQFIIPSSIDGNILNLSEEEFRDRVDLSTNKFLEGVEVKTQLEMKGRFEAGKKLFKGKRHKASIDLISQASSPKIEENLESNQSEESNQEESKIIIPEVFGGKRTPEQTKAYGEMVKKIEADIKKRQEIKDKIIELKERQKRGELLKASEIAWLNTTKVSVENPEGNMGV